MKVADIKAGMKVRAVAEYGPKCWKVGDVFEVFENTPGEPCIACNDRLNGDHHDLNSTADEDGDIPELEIVQ